MSPSPPIDPFAAIKGPEQTHELVIPLTDDELPALIATWTTYPPRRRAAASPPR